MGFQQTWDSDTVDSMIDRIQYLEAKLAPLAELGKLISTQDNRITAEPVFAVMQKRAIVVDEDYDHDRIIWVDDEGNEASDDEAERLDAMRDDIDSDYYHDDKIEYDCVEWRRLAVKEVDEFVTACFTEKGCKDYLDRNRHNLCKPFTFVFSAYRNVEWIKLRAMMLELAKDPAFSNLTDSERQRQDAERACRTLQRFANIAIDASFDGCDWHGADIQETAHQMGLLKQEPYDPDIHGRDMEGDFEPGDAIYVKTGPLNLVTQQ